MSGPLDIAWRLLKNIPLEDGGYRSTTSEDMTMEDAFDIGSGVIPYDELHSKQRQVADAILSSPKSYWNDPASGEFETENYAGMFHPETQHLYPDEAFDQYLRYLQHYFAASAETDKLPHEKQMEILHFDGVHPQHPSEIAELRMAQEYGEDWGSPTPHDDFYFRYNPETQTPTGPIATAGKRSLASRMARQRSLLRSEDAGEPMDLAMRLLKAPYNIVQNLPFMSADEIESLRPYFEQPYPQGEQHEMLFQGGKEGDDDSGYWSKDRDEALMYALFGSDFDNPIMRTGVPQLRVAPKTDDTYDLFADPETKQVGISGGESHRTSGYTTGPDIPHQIQPREDTAKQIEDLLSRWQGRDYDHASEYWSPERMAHDTSARQASQEERIAHVEEMLNRVRTGEPMDIAMRLLKSEVLLWPKRFDNRHWMMEKPGPGGYTLRDKQGKSKAFVSLPNLTGDYGKGVHSMTDEELQNAFLETDTHETMHEALGNIGEDYDKPLHNEYPAMVAEYLQYARRPREQIPSQDKVSQLLDEGMDDREIAMQIAQRMAPMHQQVSPGHNIGNIARVVTGSPNESYDDIQTGEPMDIAMRLLKENNFFDNMRAKRKRGEKPAKPGDEDYPSKDQWKDITAKSKKPDPRLKAAGVSGYNKPKRTPNHPKKSHVVVARSGGKTKTIRFGQQGKSGAGANPKTKKEKARQKSFKARHAKNIKRGPMSAAYWADKVKW